MKLSMKGIEVILYGMPIVLMPDLRHPMYIPAFDCYCNSPWQLHRLLEDYWHKLLEFVETQ